VVSRRFAAFAPAPLGGLPAAGVVVLAELAAPPAEAAAFFAPPAARRSEVTVDPLEPLAAVCGAGGLAFGVGAGGDAAAAGGRVGADGVAAGGAGADVLASSNAANGVPSSGSLSWLSVGGCARDDDVSDSAAARSDAILGTGETPGSDIEPIELMSACNRRASVGEPKNLMISRCYVSRPATA
jgi:hypothetical protein